jgi:hypothetical protein
VVEAANLKMEEVEGHTKIAPRKGKAMKMREIKTVAQEMVSNEDDSDGGAEA